MSRLILFVSCLFLCTLSVAESLRIEPKHGTFDAAVTSTTIQQTYTISNIGEKPVAIREWKAISGVGTVTGLPATLAPGESKRFTVDLRLPGSLGESAFRYALFTDETDVERYRFTLSGFVYALISPEQPLVDFGLGSVKAGTQKELTLSAREESQLKLVRIEQQPDWLDVDIDRATVKLRMRAAQTLGLKAGVVRLVTNLVQQPFVDINVRAILGGSLEASIYALGFKPTEIGDVATAGIDLSYAGKASLDELKVELPSPWTSKKSACVGPVAPGRTCIRVTVSRTIEEAGKNAGVLRFQMPGEPELSIPFGLMGLGKNQTVRELLLSDDAAAARQDRLDIANLLHAQASGAATPSPSDPPVASADSTEKVTRSRGAGPVHLKWQARHDKGIYGYMIYRAEDRAGPFRRVSRHPIRTSGESAAELSAYTFTDPDVLPGKTYFYYIDSLGKSGRQSRLSPVMSKSVTEPD